MLLKNESLKQTFSAAKIKTISQFIENGYMKRLKEFSTKTEEHSDPTKLTYQDLHWQSLQRSNI